METESNVYDFFTREALQPPSTIADNQWPGNWWGISWSEAAREAARLFGPSKTGLAVAPFAIPGFYVECGESLRIETYRPTPESLKPRDTVLFAAARNFGPWRFDSWGQIRDGNGPQREFAYVGIGEVWSLHIGRGRSRANGLVREIGVSTYAGTKLQSLWGFPIRKLSREKGGAGGGHYTIRPPFDRMRDDCSRQDGHIIATIDVHPRI